MSEERAAKRLAHEWAREIRARESSQTSSGAKLLAWTLADRAQLVTAELANELALPEEYIGTIAAWPSVQQLAADIGQAAERTTRRLLDGLSADLHVFERRHLRLPSVYMLAVKAIPMRVGDAGDRADQPGRTRGATGPISPVERVERPGRSARSNLRATGLDGQVRPGQVDRFDRAGWPGPFKEEPIKEPIREPRAAARADARAGMREAPLDAAAAAIREAWMRRTGERLPADAPELGGLAVQCVRQAEHHGGEPEAIATDVVVGFFELRSDVTRPRLEWVAERFGAYLARGRRERRREQLESERAAAEWWARPEEIPAEPPPASWRDEIERQSKAVAS